MVELLQTLDLLENLESSLSLRFGDSDIPDNVLRFVSPTIESLQSSSPDSSLSEEARRNTLHKMLMNGGQGIDNEEMKIFNDLTTYAITFEAMPDEVKNAIMNFVMT